MLFLTHILFPPFLLQFFLNTFYIHYVYSWRTTVMKSGCSFSQKIGLHLFSELILKRLNHHKNLQQVQSTWILQSLLCRNIFSWSGPFDFKSTKTERSSLLSVVGARHRPRWRPWSRSRSRFGARDFKRLPAFSLREFKYITGHFRDRHRKLPKTTPAQKYATNNTEMQINTQKIKNK